MPNGNNAANAAPTSNPVMGQPQAPTVDAFGGDDYGAGAFNLDFGSLDQGDVLENFDFDSFLNTDDAAGGFSFDASLGDFNGLDAGGDA